MSTTTLQGVSRPALSQLRIGDPVSALQQAMGGKWEEPTRRDNGWVGGKRAGIPFDARIDTEGRIGSLGFYGHFPSKYHVAGLHIGMSLEQAQAVCPELQDCTSGDEGEAAPARSYRVALADGVELSVGISNAGLLTSLSLERIGACYPDATQWTSAPPGKYPDPVDEPGAPFPDPNLKLLVLDSLCLQGLIDLGTSEELAMHVLGRYVDLDKEGYDMLPEVYDYLTRYPSSAELLARVESVSFDGSNDVYHHAWYFWDGESDDFSVTNLAGLELCTNLKNFVSVTTPGATDLQILAQVPSLELVSLEPGAYQHADVLLGLPRLTKVVAYSGSLAPDLVEALCSNGVQVIVY